MISAINKIMHNRNKTNNARINFFQKDNVSSFTGL